tara:strand:- start:2 stop:172 length:171 start_codon:yes stop_codon:yes gene_type:complete
LETQQSFPGHEADFMSKSTMVTKLQALFCSGGVKQKLLIIFHQENNRMPEMSKAHF